MDCRNVPAFFVVGAAKAGTSSLFHYLNEHPEIHMLPYKDVACYFCETYGLPITYEEYLRLLMPRNGDHYNAVGDVCHAYLTDPSSARKLHLAFPDAKIVIVLRNPADRAFSLYSWLAREGYEYADSFEEALRLEDMRFERNISKASELTQGYRTNYLYYRSGCFAEQVARYLSFFDKRNILFKKYEDMKRDTSAFVKSIYRFIGVDESFQFTKKIYNQRGFPRYVPLQYFLRAKASRFVGQRVSTLLMRCNTSSSIKASFDPRQRAMLLEKYRPDILKTEHLSGLDLSEWFK